MKTQEIVEFHIQDVLHGTKVFITDSHEEAKSYFDEGCLVTEFHIFRWYVSPYSQTATTVTHEWH
ncbi:MAG: hypothetical protein LBU65_11635 [Planctomycetaceae bacterium]|jgi:hypothetical protein|nr:hypothetical protein [Planctomycetaceae bacterium]